MGRQDRGMPGTQSDSTIRKSSSSRLGPRDVLQGAFVVFRLLHLELRTPRRPFLNAHIPACLGGGVSI